MSGEFFTFKVFAPAVGGSGDSTPTCRLGKLQRPVNFASLILQLAEYLTPQQRSSVELWAERGWEAKDARARVRVASPDDWEKLQQQCTSDAHTASSTCFIFHFTATQIAAPKPSGQRARNVNLSSYRPVRFRDRRCMKIDLQGVKRAINQLPARKHKQFVSVVGSDNDPNARGRKGEDKHSSADEWVLTDGPESKTDDQLVSHTTRFSGTELLHMLDADTRAGLRGSSDARSDAECTVTFHLNGKKTTVEHVAPGQNLIGFLREQTAYTGQKIGCGEVWLNVCVCVC
jgi:hypothetical protein